MVTLKANLDKEGAYHEGGGSKRAYNPVQYAPLPNEGGCQAQNKVVVSLVAPARWKMFNPTEQDMQKYGLSVNHVFGNDLDWGNLYFQLPAHRILNFSYPNGNTGFAYGLCPIELNKYLVEGLDLAPLFNAPVRCAYCEEKERLWDVHNAAWASLDINKDELSRDGYFAALKQHDILQKTRDVAYGMTASKKHVISIFDHDKITGTRKRDEGQDNITWQSWYAPNDIYKGIKDLHIGLSNAGMPPFFDVEHVDGVHILAVIKDTTGWTKTSKLKTDYGVQNLGERYKYSAEWLAYLKDDANYADPSSFIHMMSYEDQKYYISQLNEAKGFNKPKTTTVTANAVQPVAQPPAPTAPSPVGVAPVPITTAPMPMPMPMPIDVVPTLVTPVPVSSSVAAVPAIPVLPVAPSAVLVPPATPAPVVSGAPIPDRTPPVGGPPVATNRVDWDD